MEAEIARDLAAAGNARRHGDVEAAWQHLARAHIVSQPSLGPHLRVHRMMLGLAVASKDLPEIAGQLLRLTLAPLGHILGRIPWGNIGRATVGIMTPARVPADIAEMYAEAGLRIDQCPR
jgi:Protein of unknown function (DUF3703)